MMSGLQRHGPDNGVLTLTLELARALLQAVQGWAVGAGLELLLNCDIVLAARSARFMLPEVHAGLFVTGGVLALLPRKIGLAKAKGALMLGREFNRTLAMHWRGRRPDTSVLAPRAGR